MARRRLGVALLVPQPLATQIDGLRRALGDGALGRIEPHVTLVPPINVREEDLPAVLALVRGAASATPPLRLVLGPVTTFAPVNPVAYLRVGGEDDQVQALQRLRVAVRSGPLERADEHDFIPHVTVADELAPPDRLAAAVAALADFSAEVTFDRVHVLAQELDRVWIPMADAPLGERPGVVGRGSLPLELSLSERLDPEAGEWLATTGHEAGEPFAVTARSDGQVVAAARGWSAGGRLEVTDLVVDAAHRDRGIGRHLVVAVESLAARRGCIRAGLTAGTDGAPAALLTACGWTLVAPGADASEGRWERSIGTMD